MSTTNQNNAFDLSVIITTRNCVEQLSRCIGAVQPLMMQGELRVECLVMDMNSADATREYLEAERDRWHITNFVSAPFRNRFEAMNHGLQMAQGKICLFITPETELMVENTLTGCSPILEGGSECVFSSAVQVHTENGLHRPQMPNTEHLYLRIPCNHAAFFCSADLLRRLRGFDFARYPEVADVDLMHRALAAGVPYRITTLSTCRQYLCQERKDDEAIHVDFLRFIASHREEILRQCREHPSYSIRTIHEILRHAVRCNWPVEGNTLSALDKLLQDIRREIRPGIKRKIIRRLRRRALAQALLIPFKGLRRAHITVKICRSHFHVARLLGEDA